VDLMRFRRGGTVHLLSIDENLWFGPCLNDVLVQDAVDLRPIFLDGADSDARDGEQFGCRLGELGGFQETLSDRYNPECLFWRVIAVQFVGLLYQQRRQLSSAGAGHPNPFDMIRKLHHDLSGLDTKADSESDLIVGLARKLPNRPWRKHFLRGH
jgi:hypothetical protein